jgi:hypothetical protein
VAQLLQAAPHLRHLALHDIWGLGAGVLEAVAQHAAQLYSLDLTGSCRYADPEALRYLEPLQQLRELSLARWGSAGWCMHRREYEDPLTWAWWVLLLLLLLHVLVAACCCCAGAGLQGRTMVACKGAVGSLMVGSGVHLYSLVCL